MDQIDFYFSFRNAGSECYRVIFLLLNMSGLFKSLIGCSRELLGARRFNEAVYCLHVIQNNRTEFSEEEVRIARFLEIELNISFHAPSSGVVGLICIAFDIFNSP